MDVPKPPEELRNIIDKLAQFVARNGPEFEQMTKNKQSGNPKFLFLFGGEYNAYYRFRVASEHAMLKNNDMTSKGSPQVALPSQPPPPGLHAPIPMPIPMNSFYPPHPHHPHQQPPPPSTMQPPLVPVSQVPQTPFLPPPANSNNFNIQQPAPGVHLPSHPPPGPPAVPFGEEPFHPNNPQQYIPHQKAMTFMTYSTTGHPQMSPSNNINNNWNHHSDPNHSLPPPNNNMNNNSKSEFEIDSKIKQLQDHIEESEKNLCAQREVIMRVEVDSKIEELIKKSFDDELKRMCEDYNINLNEFDKILQPIIETCRKESIANGKIWIFNNCHISEHYDAVAKHLLKKVSRVDSQFEAKLHIMYLINDIFNHCMRKNDDKLKTAIVKIIVPAFSLVVQEANEEKKSKMNKLLKLWEMNQYLDHSLLDQLKNPEESLDAYKTSLKKKYAEQIQLINNEQSNKYNQIQKQHNDFVVHCNKEIQQLQHQKHSLQANLNIRPPISTVTNTPNIYGPPSIPGQVSGTLVTGQHPPIPGPPTHQLLLNEPSTSLPYSQPPPPNFALPSANPVVSQAPPHIPPFQGPHPPFPNTVSQHQPGNFFSNTGPGIYPPNSTTISNMLPIQSTPPNIHAPPTGLTPAPIIPIIPTAPAAEEIQAPYFDLPAGIMTQLIKLEDFDYNPIEPSEIKMPPLLPPSERLLKALEAFYTPPSHDQPRNPEGWEKLGLYEFFKAKSQARKDYEAKIGDNGQRKENDNAQFEDTDSMGLTEKQNDTYKKSFSETSPPKRSYKEFKEEKSPTRSRSRSVEKRRSKRSRSRSSSRSPSRTPPRSHRKESSDKYSKSRSKAQETSKYNSSKKHDSGGHSNDKTSHLGKKMTWSSNTGFKIKEQTYKEPVTPIQKSSDQYRGVGSTDVLSHSSDPFESFRRGKGQAYIQRIRDGRRD